MLKSIWSRRCAHENGTCRIKKTLFFFLGVVLYNTTTTNPMICRSFFCFFLFFFVLLCRRGSQSVNDADVKSFKAMKIVVFSSLCDHKAVGCGDTYVTRGHNGTGVFRHVNEMNDSERDDGGPLFGAVNHCTPDSREAVIRRCESIKLSLSLSFFISKRARGRRACGARQGTRQRQRQREHSGLICTLCSPTQAQVCFVV